MCVGHTYCAVSFWRRRGRTRCDLAESELPVAFVLMRVLAPLLASAATAPRAAAPAMGLVAQLTAVGQQSPLAFSATYICGDLLSIPVCAVLAPLSGVLFGIPFGVLLVLGSGSASAAISFLLARLVLRERLLARLQRSPALARKFGFLDRVLTKGGCRAMVLLRIMPTPLPVVNYLYGVTGLAFSDYMLGTILGYLPGTAAIVVSGAAGKQLFAAGGAAAPVWAYALGAAALAALVKLLTTVARDILEELGAPDDTADRCSPWAPPEACEAEGEAPALGPVTRSRAAGTS